MSWADAYVGIPYKSMGRKIAGCDCWGLVRIILRDQCNYLLPSYNEDDPGGATIAFHAQKWPHVDLEDAREFDVAILFRPVRLGLLWENKPNHIGIFVNAKSILHINEGSQSIVQPAKELKRKIHSILRVV